MFLPSSLCPDRLWGPFNLLPNGYHKLFPGEENGRGLKLRSPSTSASIENLWNCTYTPPYVFLALYVIKHTENYNFCHNGQVLSFKEISACLLLLGPSTLKMEVVCSCETSVNFYRTTWSHMQEDSTVHGVYLSCKC
jgi:hypothetical protein